MPIGSVLILPLHPKKQFNAPFLDSARLISKFGADTVFADTGINADLPLRQLEEDAQRLESKAPYLATHMRSAYQTAIAASIVNRTLVHAE